MEEDNTSVCSTIFPILLMRFILSLRQLPISLKQAGYLLAAGGPIPLRLVAILENF